MFGLDISNNSFVLATYENWTAEMAQFENTTMSSIFGMTTTSKNVALLLFRFNNFSIERSWKTIQSVFATQVFIFEKSLFCFVLFSLFINRCRRRCSLLAHERKITFTELFCVIKMCGKVCGKVCVASKCVAKCVAKWWRIGTFLKKTKNKINSKIF